MKRVDDFLYCANYQAMFAKCMAENAKYERGTSFGVVRPELIDQWHPTKNGDLDPETVTYASRKKVWWQCPDDPEHSWQANVSNRVRFGYGCPICAGNIVKKEESFAVLFPDLLKEWDYSKNGNLDPYAISRGSSKRIWWRCSKNPEHEWQVAVSNRTLSGRGCPFCSGHRVAPENSLATVRPDVAIQWDYEKNGDLTPDEVTVASGKNVWWKCEVCFREWRTRIKMRTVKDSVCPSCKEDKAKLTRKQRKLEEELSDQTDYDYDFEGRVQIESAEFQKIFSNFINIDRGDNRHVSSILSPRSLNRIDFRPYYQRKYVWDKDKATYFLESVLLGTEIPPLIFFEYKNAFEVIDGRQRFETLLHFLRNEIALSRKGLRKLSFLVKKNYDSLPDEFRDRFLDTQIRIYSFKASDHPEFSESQRDMLKKEIFKRYNSGITPLRKVEINKAIFIDDNPTIYFKRRLGSSPQLKEKLVRLFLREGDQAKLEDPNTTEKLLDLIRLLLIAPDLPVKSLRRTEVTEPYYERFAESGEDMQEVFKSFTSRIGFLLLIEEAISSSGVTRGAYWNETLYWALAVAEKEGVDLSSVLTKEVVSDFANYASSSMEMFSVAESGFLYAQFVARYQSMGDFSERVFKINLAAYFESSRGQISKLTERPVAADQPIIGLGAESLKKTPVSYNVEDICQMMERKKFLIRPPYQRGEVINKTKSSKIIESILLGMNLPPLYIYAHDDGLYEVIDGQQRLLSILGFVGKHFYNESNERCLSNKNEYALTQLEVLTDLNRKKFVDLDISLQDKIWDHSLSLLIIDQDSHPDFEPVDLFVRLNSRPFPIKENTFEMWNSCVSKAIIDEIRSVCDKHAAWFNLNPKNTRLRNEELVTILAYFEYRMKFECGAQKDDFLQITQRSDNVYVRLKDKKAITKLLHKASCDDETRDQMLMSIKLVDRFVLRLKTIFLESDPDNVEQHLNEQLTKLFNAQKRRYYVRKSQDFYSLWYILHEINQTRADRDRNLIRSDLFELYSIMKNYEYGEGEDAIEDFRGLIDDFTTRYAPTHRNLRLTKNRKVEILLEQQNKCHICNGPLFLADRPHFDHIEPVAIGGADTDTNIRATHKTCNLRKGIAK